MSGPNSRLSHELKTSALWPLLKAKLQSELQKTMIALVDAPDSDTVRLLQGRALAYRTILTFPEYIATLAKSEKEDGNG